MGDDTMLFALSNTDDTRRNADDEIKLMKRVQAQDVSALEELYNLYNQLIFGLVISIVKKREEAEKLLQEIFLKVWQKAELFDADRGNVYNWMVTLARNQSIGHIRIKGNKEEVTHLKSSDDPIHFMGGDQENPMETTIFSNRAELVKKALEQIPEKQSEVIKIAFYRGMTQSQIAEYLEVPLDTVRNRTRQGMIRLKTILGEFISTDG